MKFGLHAQLTELLAEGATRGQQWRVTIIEAGTSANGVTYPLGVLHEAAPKFEGARVLARSDEEHSKGTADATKTVGWLSDIKPTPAGLDATLHLLDAGGLRERLVEAWERGKKDLMGLSIVALGEIAMRAGSGPMQRVAKSIRAVRSVDLVMHPAAGGKLVAMTAAIDEESSAMLEKLCKLLEAQFPAKWAAVKDQELTEALVLTTLTEAVTEAASGKNPDPAAMQALQAELKALTEAVTAAAKSEPKGGQKPDQKPEHVDPVKLTEAARAEARQAVAYDRMVETRLRDVHPKVADRVRERASATVLTEAQLGDVLKEEVAYAEALGGRGYRQGAQVPASAKVTGLTEGERLKLALDGLFLQEDVVHEGQKIPRLRSFKEGYIAITGDRGVTGLLHEAKNIEQFITDINHGQSAVMTEAISTSTFAQALGDSIRRAMNKLYAEADQDQWKLVSDIVPAADFRTKHLVRMGGYGTLPAVNQDAAYQPLSTPTDDEETYAISKKGGLETISIEAISNDDVGLIQRIPRMLNFAAKYTLNSTVLGVLVSNPTMGDTNALFSVAHANTATGALAEATLEAGDLAIRNQTTPAGNGGGASTRKLGLKGKYLLVPTALRKTAWLLTVAQNAMAMGGVGNVASNDDAALRYIRSLGIIPVEVPHWADANDWVLAGDKMQCGILEVGFWNGREEPELFVADNPSAGSLFTNDQIQYKIRHVYGVGIYDWRNVYKAIVA